MKMRFLHDGWWALMAGNTAQADELLAHYAASLRRSQPPSDNIVESLRQPIYTMRKSLANALTQRKAALSYDDFLEKGAVKLHSDLFRELSYEIAAQTLECELLLIGWVGGHFYIYQYFGGELTECSDFGVIGSGRWIAEGNLYQRRHDRLNSLEETIYRVYESKRLGEIAPGVGKSTNITVISRENDKSVSSTLVGTFELLNTYLKKFGPQPIQGIAYPQSFWDKIASDQAAKVVSST